VAQHHLVAVAVEKHNEEILAHGRVLGVDLEAVQYLVEPLRVCRAPVEGCDSGKSVLSVS
jgi:hypothetical protein